MKPIAFDGHNIVYAKDHPEYLPLPAFTDGTTTVSCWALTWRERFTLLVRGKLWFSQMNFGKALQPIRPDVESPLEVVSSDPQPPSKEAT